MNNLVEIDVRLAWSPMEMTLLFCYRPLLLLVIYFPRHIEKQQNLQMVCV